MEKGSTNPFQGEQDPEQFLPDEQNKNQSTYATQPRNHCTFVHHGVRTPKDHCGATYTKQVSSFFVVITWKVAKHASYSGIVRPSTNQTQWDDCSLETLKLGCKICLGKEWLGTKKLKKIQTIDTSASASWLNLLSVSITFTWEGKY